MIGEIQDLTEIYSETNYKLEGYKINNVFIPLELISLKLKNKIEVYKNKNKHINSNLTYEVFIDKKIKKNIENYNKKFNNKLNKLLKKFRELLTDTIQFDVLSYEYSRKESRALKAKETNDFSIFNEVSKSYGVSSEDYCNLILNAASVYHDSEDKFIFYLSNFRSRFSKASMDKNIEDLKNIIVEINNIDINTYLPTK